MKKIYYLQTCDTCKRIMKEMDFSGFEKQNIKAEAITAEQLDEMKELAGSYEALFSRKARKYKELGLKNQTLTEKDYREYILNDYTFLKRPVVIDQNEIFIGNEKKNLERLALHLNN
ncbi:arsenate reductase family protein [Moheibacter sp.]|uniref:arsenate reductase family protein n=1 Tax=Moheibacter sp. TaxID=1965316 RepID=UPI003C737890